MSTPGKCLRRFGLSGSSTVAKPDLLESTTLPHDPALPQLAQALDGAAMAQVFGAALDGMQVQSCAVDRVKYRPGRNCSVSYVLALRDERRGGAVEQRVAARFCSGGDAARRHRQALGRARLASAAGPALTHLPALDMLAHWWPNDAKLDAPAWLHDDARLRSHSPNAVDAVVAALTGGRGSWVAHRMSLVQYVPEARVCARVELQLRPAPGAPVTSLTLYAKADTARNGAATQALMLALHNSPAQAGGQLRTPQPVLWHAATGLHWQLAVPGRALLDVDPRVGPATSARVGAQLAALHATKLPLARTLPIASWREAPRRVAELLGRVEPGWALLLTRLVGRLEAGALERMDALAREPVVTLHGDLHPRNILLDGSALAFIDLDDASHGPAVIELGAWVGDALYRVLLAGESPSQAAPSWRAFIAAYESASGRAVDESLLAWSTAHHLLCQRAYRCVANLKPGRFEVVPQLLALAELIAAAGTVDAAVACEREAA